MSAARSLLRTQRLASRSLRGFLFKSSKPVEDSVGLFGNKLLKSPDGFKELNKQIRENCSKIVFELTKGRSDRTKVQLFDDLSNEICRAADLVECVRQLHSDPSYVAAAETSARDFCLLVESLNTYTALYDNLKASIDTESSRLDEVDRRTINLFLDDFEQSGVHLPEEKRNDFVNLSGEIFDACAHFQSNCDMPATISSSQQKQYRLNSNQIYSPSSYSRNSAERKFIYESFFQHRDDQEKQLVRLVLKRNELARLTGFPSFAHRAQFNTLLGDYDKAHDFVWGVIESCRASAEQELAVLMDVLAQCDHEEKEVGEWDIHYLTSVYKDRAFGDAHKRVRSEFLKLGTLMDGFETLTKALYGVRLEEQKLSPGEVWSGTVIKFGAYRENGEFLGHIYADVDRRTTKAAGDCHYTVRCSKELPTGEWQTPIVVLSLSLASSPTKNWRDVTIGFHAAENLFHEMGHAMHSMLGRTKYQHVAGTRCPQDFSEIPSNLMEYFFCDLNVMQRILRNSKGESISMDDAASLIASRFAFSSLEVVQQASYALFDLELHSSSVAQLLRENRLTTTELFHSISTKALPALQRSPQTAFQHRFHHVVQYGAKYYSYLVARSAGSLIYNSRFRANPFDATYGAKWAEVQSHGGGHPPAHLLKLILGYTPTADHLVSTLKEELTPVANLDAINVQ